MIFVGPAVRRAHRAAGAAGDRRADGRGGGDAGRVALHTVRRVILPAVIAPALTGLALAFARAVGEYGSIVFISGNMPMKTEIVPLLIVTKLEQFDYAGATAMALVMLAGVVRHAVRHQQPAGLDPPARRQRTRWRPAR